MPTAARFVRSDAEESAAHFCLGRVDVRIGREDRVIPPPSVRPDGRCPDSRRPNGGCRCPATRVVTPEKWRQKVQAPRQRGRG